MSEPQTEQRFDRLIRAFLNERAETAAFGAISADAMAARLGPIVTTRRVRFRTPAFRWVPLTRLPIVAVVMAVVIVVGGVLILSRLADQRVATPSPGPSATARPSPTTVTLLVVPETLRGLWVGGPRSLTDVPHTGATHLNVNDLSLGIDSPLGSLQQPVELLTSASGTSDGTLRLTISSSCEGGAVGDYRWSLSAGGGRLAITAVSDACAVRVAAVAGDWYRVGCKDARASCLGDLEPGTYESQNFAPHLKPVKPGEDWSPTYAALTYTVPVGWANASDWIVSFSLAPSSDYGLYTADGPPTGGTHEIALYAQPAVSDQNPECSGPERTDVPRTAVATIEFIRGLRSVSSSAPQPITIDGHDGRWVDVRIAPGWTGTCPGNALPVAQLLRWSGEPVSWNLELRGDARMRVIAVDLGQGDVVVVAVVSDDPARFDDLVAQSMPIIESFRLK